MIRFTRMLIAFCLGWVISTAAHATERWDFVVYLDDKPFGTHVYEVVDVDGGRVVQSKADFEYKLFFFSAFRYEHENKEFWTGDCLDALDARTDTNGEQIQVTGQKTETAFTVQRDGQNDRLPECVMSFAYWNPDFLQEQKLVNPQTGEYIAVDVQRDGAATLDIKGESVEVEQYRLTAKGFDLTLWYSENGRWLGLESVAKGGRIIRYELA